MTYKLTNSSAIVRVEDGACIPADPANTDYAAYLAWRAEGNTPEPADLVAPTVPQVVSRFQARAALHLAGLLDDVEALMAAPDTPALAKLAWADAMEFERQSPTIAALAGAVGLTEQDIDALFITAAGIKA